MQIVSSDGSILRRASLFERFAKQAEYAMGHPQAFAVALGVILLADTDTPEVQLR